MNSMMATANPTPTGPDRAPQDASATLSLDSLLSSLRRSAGSIALCAVTGAVLAYLYASGLEKSYTASAALAVEGDRIAIPELQGALRGDNSPDPMPLVHTEVQALSARQLVQTVSDQLHLDRTPEFNGALRPPSVGARVKAWLASQLPARAPAPPNPAAANDSILNAVTHSLIISQDNRSLVIAVDFVSHDPALAARFVNTLITTYIATRAQRRTLANTGANTIISQRIEQVRADIDRIEKQMRTLRNTSGLVGLRAGSVGQQQLEDLATAASRATLERSQIEANWERAAALASGGSSDALASVLGSETISRLREQEGIASAHVADLSQHFGPAYPALRSAEADLAATRSQIAGETHRIVASLATQLRVARAHEADVLAQLAAARHAGVEAQNTQAEIDQLQQDATTRRQLYRTLLERVQQTANQPQGSETPDVRVLSSAVPPGLPSAPNLKEAAALGGLGGSVLAWGVALAFLRQSVPLSGEDFARQAGVGIAARLRRKGRGPGMAAQLALRADGPEADAMRLVRQRLEQMSRTNPRVVAFVGAQATDLAAAAACAYARAAAWGGRRVLLIDLAMDDGFIKRMLRAPDGRLGDVLSGVADGRGAAGHDSVGGLDYLVGGPAQSLPDSRRAVIGLENLLAEAADDYDIIVLGAPAAGRADAGAMLRSSDAAVLVIDNGRAGDAASLAAAAALRAAARVPFAALLVLD